ncbi:basic proline-rich protein [Micromonospora sp. M42]|nr:basic proline-rich protein [Micromonospora sp. M42]
MLRGSHARRAATEHSDVDVDVLVAADEPRATGGPRPVTSRRGTPYAARRAYLTEFGGRLVHVSVAARDVRSWVRRLGQPADWAFGLPVTAPARLLWAVPEWRRRIDLPVLCQPADEPRLEELIATLGKVAAARLAGDPAGVRRRGRPGPALPLGAAAGQPVGARGVPPGRPDRRAGPAGRPGRLPRRHAPLPRAAPRRPGRGRGRRRTAGHRHPPAGAPVRGGDRPGHRDRPGRGAHRRPGGPLPAAAGPGAGDGDARLPGHVGGPRAACGRMVNRARP